MAEPAWNTILIIIVGLFTGACSYIVKNLAAEVKDLKVAFTQLQRDHAALDKNAITKDDLFRELQGLRGAIDNLNTKFDRNSGKDADTRHDIRDAVHAVLGGVRAIQQQLADRPQPPR